MVFSLHATVAVITRTPGAIYIGADSKNSTIGGQKPDHAQICKIYRVGGLVFAHARYYRMPGILDKPLPEYARQYLSVSGTLAQRVDNYEKRIRPLLVDALHRIVEGNDSLIPKLDNVRMVEIAVAQVPDGAYYISVDAHWSGNEFRVDVDKKYVTENHSLAIGADEAKADFGKFWNAPGKPMDTSLRIKDFVEREEGEYPSVIGGPVAVIEITAKGSHFVIPGVCEVPGKKATPTRKEQPR